MFLGASPLIPNESPSLYIDLCLKGNCYPQEIFLEPHLIENFICPIDFGVCREPIIDTCGHTFGKICITNCLKNSNKCPLTNKPYSYLKKFATNFGIKSFLAGLNIKCINNNMTCIWQGKLDELEKHLAHDCVDIKEDCPIEGCQEKIARGELLEHIENSCKFVKMKCLFESQGCSDMMNSRDFPFHLVNHHYEEIFQCVKKFDFLNKEKEIYEKKYNDLLMAFFLVDNQRKKIINNLKEENVMLKNKLLKCISTKVTKDKKELLIKNEKKFIFDEKKVSSFKNSFESSQKNENFDKYREGKNGSDQMNRNIIQNNKNNNSQKILNTNKRALTPRKQMPLKKKIKFEDICFSCRNVKN